MISKILVVDDESDAREVIGTYLRQAGFIALFAGDGATALTIARTDMPALIVLDVMMPLMDGFEVCRVLRREAMTATIPIIMLSARDAEVDRIVGLELGADDYVTKPFSPRELVVRIRKLLARVGTQTPSGIITTGELRINLPRREVGVGGRPVGLTAMEFKLLETLIRDAGRVYRREELLRQVWHHEKGSTSRTIDTHMRRLREKLGPAARHLETVRGIGYRFSQVFAAAKT